MPSDCLPEVAYQRRHRREVVKCERGEREQKSSIQQTLVLSQEDFEFVDCDSGDQPFPRSGGHEYRSCYLDMQRCNSFWQIQQRLFR